MALLFSHVVDILNTRNKTGQGQIIIDTKNEPAIRELFDEKIEDITRKLSFRFAWDEADLANAFYSESMLRGHVVVAPNTGEEESKLDLELLYKAIVTNPHRITQLFQA